jgi:hypothetical protein
MLVGILKEITAEEHRVSMIPITLEGVSDAFGLKYVPVEDGCKEC